MHAKQLSEAIGGRGGGKGDVLQFVAIAKRHVLNMLEGVGEIHPFQGGAFFKGAAANKAEPLGQGDPFQSSASAKGEGGDVSQPHSAADDMVGDDDDPFGDDLPF